MNQLFEESVRIRDCEKYTEIFDTDANFIFTLEPQDFLDFGATEIDPRWLTFGVFKAAPNETRASWLFVSAGMSNPWSGVAAEYSGFGVEFVLESTNDESWAVAALRTLIAYNILVASGFFENQKMLNYGDRVALTLLPNITHFIGVYPSHYPAVIDLPSGKVNLIHFIGITRNEFEFSRRQGSSLLEGRLKTLGVYPITDPHRSGIF